MKRFCSIFKKWFKVVFILVVVLIILHLKIFKLGQQGTLANKLLLEKNQIIGEEKFTALQQQTKVNDIYNQLIDLKDFKFLINPQVCSSCQGDFFLISIILSSHKNYKKRCAIRKIWMQTNVCKKTVFLLGVTNNMYATKRLQSESERYGDIVQGNFMDTYRNLTYKHVMGLKWVSHHCTRAKYIVKIDDDIVVNIDLLYDMLKTDYWGSKGLIGCSVRYYSPVLRDHPKWAVTEEEYKGECYPTRCVGAFIIYSADVAHKLVEASLKERYFFLEDVHVTGTLANRVNITHVDTSPWFVSRPEVDLAKDKKNVKFYGPWNQWHKNFKELWKRYEEREEDMRKVLRKSIKIN